MKSTLKKLIRKFGIDIVRYHPSENSGKSERTRALTYYKTTTGNYYLPTDAHGDIVANTIKNNQVFESEVIDLAKKYIKPGSVVLDVGANFGQMSILFSNMLGSNGKVHSFDADDWVFQIFCKNIEANNKKENIIPHFGAVHNENDVVLVFPEQDFKEFSTYGSYGIDYNAREGRKIKSLTIDSLNIQDPISFIKIDIQGGDLQAMQGAVKTIERNKCPILFEYEYHFEEKYNMCFQDYVDFVASIGYKFSRVISGHNFLIIPKI